MGHGGAAGGAFTGTRPNVHENAGAGAWNSWICVLIDDSAHAVGFSSAGHFFRTVPIRRDGHAVEDSVVEMRGGVIDALDRRSQWDVGHIPTMWPLGGITESGTQEENAGWRSAVAFFLYRVLWSADRGAVRSDEARTPAHSGPPNNDDDRALDGLPLFARACALIALEFARYGIPSRCCYDNHLR